MSPACKSFGLWLILPFCCLAKVDFVHQVMPILKMHCAECHTDGAQKGGLSMNTRTEFLAGGEGGEVAVPGNPEDSWFLAVVASEDSAERMPPKGPGLSGGEIEVLRTWVAEGMRWDEGITLGSSGWEPPLKPRVVEVPPARRGRTHPIDRILDDYFEENRISPPAPSHDRSFARRAYLDLIGILPTPEELESFLANPAKDKRNRLVEDLLSREVDYADHWLTFWNDLLRNDYTGTGFITGGRKQITSWLYDSLRTNKTYDVMTRELIVGQGNAAGFINGIKWRGNVNASQTRDMQFAQNVSQVFLGINMKCASCHDSFIDRWTLQEAYDLAAVFSETPLELERCDVPTGKMATPRWMFPKLGQIDANAKRNERLGQLAGLLTHPENGRFTRTIVNRLWAQLMGRGIVHPVDAMHTEPWNENLLDYLAVRFAEDGYDLRKFLALVMSSEAYRAQSESVPTRPGEDYQFRGPAPKRMSAEQLMDTIWQVTRTYPVNAEAKVDRSERLPESERPKLPDLGKAGKITARWIWGPNPNARKVRLRKSVTLEKQPAFASLIATCDNAFSMKINGAFLTSSENWQKPVYHEISSFLQAGENLIEVDAEMHGGASGFVAHLKIGKVSVRIIETDGSWEVQKQGQWQPAKEGHTYGSGPWKRILHEAHPTAPGVRENAPPIRASLVKNDFLMRSLGRPHRDQVVTSRPAELTTLQAIDLANGEILSQYLKRGAENLAPRASIEQGFVDWLYQHSLSRPPSSGERTVLQSVLTDSPEPSQVEDLLWLVFMQPDFQIIR